MIDARELADGLELDCDVCIIGAGAAAITIAREFLGTKLRLCVLEGGGLDYSEASQAIYKGKNVGSSYYDLAEARLRYFGGSTNHWGGMCTPLNEIDFAARSWVPYSGWPIGRTDLDPFYERAQILCEIGPFAYGEQIWKDLGVTPPAYDGKKLVSRFWQFSPPTRFGEVYREELRAAENLRVLLHANVINIQADPSGNFIESVDFVTLAGKRGRVSTKQFVLACGAIENPRLLLLSNGVEPRGLGNRYDIVGRFFMEHPGAPCGRIAARHPEALIDLYDRQPLDGFDVRPFLCPSDTLQEAEEILNGSVTVEVVPVPGSATEAAKELWRGLKKGNIPDEFDEKIWRVISDIDEVIASAWRRFGEGRPPTGPVAHIGLYARAEQAPNPESRVRLSGERDALGLRRVELDWRLTALDKHSVDVLTRTIAEEFGRLGIGRVKIGDWLLDASNGWHEEMAGQWHHMGTTRMADDPERGVVDADCKVHGLANFYIAGSSVFPTGGYANPTLTIVALALRLSDHLKKQLA